MALSRLTCKADTKIQHISPGTLFVWNGKFGIVGATGTAIYGILFAGGYLNDYIEVQPLLKGTDIVLTQEGCDQQ